MGIHDVTVEQVEGQLTDHYNPSAKAERLSESVYASTSLAAAAIAAHKFCKVKKIGALGVS